MSPVPPACLVDHPRWTQARERRLPNSLFSPNIRPTQLFNGYGDSLLDYNRRRTVLSIGLSLVDF